MIVDVKGCTKPQFGLVSEMKQYLGAACSLNLRNEGIPSRRIAKMRTRKKATQSPRIACVLKTTPASETEELIAKTEHTRCCELVAS